MNTFLGATLYVPAIHKNLEKTLMGNLTPGLTSMVICTEDSIKEADLTTAYSRIEKALKLPGKFDPQVFIRPRNLEGLKRLLTIENIDRIEGFVLPKITVANLQEHLDALAGTDHKIMITLETIDVLDPNKLVQLRTMLMAKEVRHRIHALRIGGNDLLSLLGIRRPKQFTIYETPLGFVISQIVTTFAPYGFNITSPVCELLDSPELLRRELEMDRVYGLSGKTAIHQSQVDIINPYFTPSEIDLKTAHAILAEDAPAVFKLDGAMCEPSTHTTWARRMVSSYQAAI